MSQHKIPIVKIEYIHKLIDEVSFERRTFIAWGKNEIVVNPAAIHPMISTVLAYFYQFNIKDQCCIRWNHTPCAL